MKTRSFHLPWILALAACELDGGWAEHLPEVVASSRYVDLRVDAEPSAVCMEDKLAELDRFMEETAAFLDVPVPPGRTGFVIMPVDLRTPENWPCSEVGNSCYVLQEEGGLVFDQPTLVGSGRISLALEHEFVHAIDLPTNGRSHWVLEEGLATYLGTDFDAAPVMDSFPGALLDGLTMTTDGDYGVAMQFVGSLLEQYGVARFKEFRREVAHSAAVEVVAAAFERVYGEDFEDALEAMSTTAIHGQLIDDTCDGEVVSWSGTDPLQAELTATCGDGWFYGGLGFNLSLLAPEDDPAAYAKFYVIEVPESAIYTLTIAGSDLRAFGAVNACGDTPGGGTGVSYGGHGNTAVLEAGEYELFVGFPEGAATDVSVTLAYQGPLPSP